MNVFLIVIGIVAAIAGIVIPIILQDNANRHARYNEQAAKVKKAPWIALMIFGIAMFIAGNCFEIIPTGYTGVRTTFGQISEKTASNGFCAKAPFIEDIKQVNNKHQDVNIKNQIWGETKEKTPVYADDVVVTYYIAPEHSARLYATVDNLDNMIDSKLVASAIKSALVEQSVETVTNRSYIEPAAAQKLQAQKK